jgi:hypothetical protein
MAVTAGSGGAGKQHRASSNRTVMAIHFHEEDLPSVDVFAPGTPIVVDTEAMG